jgi:DNA-binding response OmpR family regulator
MIISMSARSPGERGRVLVVDDEPLIRRLMRRCLVVSGFEVIEAPGVTAAIDLLEAQVFDAMTTDLRMPGRNGIELITWARANRPGLPVLCVTALAEEVELSVPVLGKPFNMYELVSAVEALMAGRALQTRTA